METALSVGIGIGLAAACGLRVFLPLLAVSLAARTGYLPLASGFEWIGTTPALIAFAAATALEIAAYYVPWLDHLLDAVATPAAVIAGIVAAASVLTDAPPVVRWGVAIIAGGGVAGGTQGVTALLRLKSTVLTGGLANPVLATAEWVGAAVASALVILLPLLGLLLLAMALCLALFLLRRLSRATRGRAT